MERRRKQKRKENGDSQPGRGFHGSVVALDAVHLAVHDVLERVGPRRLAVLLRRPLAGVRAAVLAQRRRQHQPELVACFSLLLLARKEVARNQIMCKECRCEKCDSQSTGLSLPNLESTLMTFFSRFGFLFSRHTLILPPRKIFPNNSCFFHFLSITSS